MHFLLSPQGSVDHAGFVRDRENAGKVFNCITQPRNSMERGVVGGKVTRRNCVRMLKQGEGPKMIRRKMYVVFLIISRVKISSNNAAQVDDKKIRNNVPL